MEQSADEERAPENRTLEQPAVERSTPDEAAQTLGTSTEAEDPRTPPSQGEQAAEAEAAAWAARIIKPLLELSQELWTALNTIKCEGDPLRELFWKDLEEVRVGLRDPSGPPPKRRVAGIKQEKSKADFQRATETRWRRHLRPAEPSVSVPDPLVMGEALALLHKMRHRLPPSRCPMVWQLIKDGVDIPTEPPHPEIGGLAATWRLVHQQSSGKAFLSWRVRIAGARFEMETDPTRPRCVDGLRALTEKVLGDVEAAGALFSFKGKDQDGRPVAASFQSPGGHVPSASSINFAYGLIQRVGSSGLYSARAVLTRGDVHDDELGSFVLQDVKGKSLHGLPEDMATIAKSIPKEASAVLTSLLSAPDK